MKIIISIILVMLGGVFIKVLNFITILILQPETERMLRNIEAISSIVTLFIIVFLIRKIYKKSA